MNKRKLISFGVLLIVMGAVFILSPKSQLYLDSRGIPEVHIRLFGWQIGCHQSPTLVYSWDESTKIFKPTSSPGQHIKGEVRATPVILDDRYHPMGWCDYASCNRVDFNISLVDLVYTGERESPIEDFNGIKGQHQRIPS